MCKQLKCITKSNYQQDTNKVSSNVKQSFINNIQKSEYGVLV